MNQHNYNYTKLDNAHLNALYMRSGVNYIFRQSMFNLAVSSFNINEIIQTLHPVIFSLNCLIETQNSVKVLLHSTYIDCESNIPIGKNAL